MLNCKQAAERASNKLDRRLPVYKRMGLWLHTGMCQNCRRYIEQLKLLRNSSAKLNAHIENCSDKTLSETSKNKIKKYIQQEREEK
ncbi:MAG: hypothetical protein GXP14_12990 [Gammaproteobacteria bacterium]|nr:hypothetical protein [Gammaproteobacteria bacterium]